MKTARNRSNRTGDNVTYTVFHLNALRKKTLAALAREFGLRRDWARVSIGEIRALLRTYPVARLVAAAKACGEFSEDELKLVTDPDMEYDNDDDGAVEDDTAPPPPAAAPRPAPAPAPAPAVQYVAALPSAPKTQQEQIAELLTKLLTSAPVNRDEVMQIVEPRVTGVRNELMGTLRGSADALMQQVNDNARETRLAVGKALEELRASIGTREIVIKQGDRAPVTIDGLQHNKFEELLTVVSAVDDAGHHLNAWLYGPPGTGKTTGAANCAKALGRKFYCTGALMSKYDVTGFIDANGRYVRSTFREAWEHGGVYLWDEIDGSAPQAIVAFNAALANGIMAFPDGMIERHKDCILIAGSNTVNGATAEFTGRTKLDAASIDRWILIEWGIDANVEKAMAGQWDGWYAEVLRVRNATQNKGVKVLITPRATKYGAALLTAGMQFEKVRELVLRKGMTAEQWQMVR